MLRIHDVMLDAISMMRPMVRAIEKYDRDLGSQLRRAASSVVLNIAHFTFTPPPGPPPRKPAALLVLSIGAGGA